MTEIEKDLGLLAARSIPLSFMKLAKASVCVVYVDFHNKTYKTHSYELVDQIAKDYMRVSQLFL